MLFLWRLSDSGFGYTAFFFVFGSATISRYALVRTQKKKKNQAEDTLIIKK